MPIIQIQSNVKVSRKKIQDLMSQTAQTVSCILEKPLNDVMVFFDPVHIYYSQNSEPAAFIEIICLSGAHIENSRKITCELALLLEKQCSIPSDRVYIHIIETPAKNSWRLIQDKAVCPHDKKNIQ